MNLFKSESFKDVIVHIGIILTITTLLILLFFYIYLPNTTNHGEYITVPKLEGLTLEQAQELIDSKNLRLEINDSTFKPGITPNTVLTQHPGVNAQVKENRRIYISIAAFNPPDVKMPNLIDKTQREVEMMLKSLGLQLGTITIKPNPSPVVMQQNVNNKPIESGSLIAKGSKIDLVIGSGKSTEMVSTPNLKGKTIEEAKAELETLGLTLGITIAEPNSSVEAEQIYKQKPSSTDNNGTINKGASIDVWVNTTE
jgi:beta-lactam-binding protein with PASTA domain